MVELRYLDTFSKIFVHEGESKTNAVGMVHKYVRSIFLNHFGAEGLKEKLLPQIEEFVNKSLCAWSSKASVEVKHSGSVMVFNFSARQMISYDAEKSSDDLSEKYTKIIDGLMSFPLNIPGTAYYNCSKHQKNVTTMLRDMLKERWNSPEKRRGDFLDQINVDMEKEKFLSEDFSIQLVFGGLFATFESVSAVLALAFSLLAEHPSVVEELTVTPNLYGNLVANTAAGIAGGTGVMPGGNVGADHAVFEQGASAGNVGNEKLWEQKKANPVALLLSSAMMLRHLQFPSFADRLETAVKRVISEGKYRTKDLGGVSTTQEVVDAVIANLD